VREVNDLGAGDAEEQIFGTTREAGHLVREHRPADDELVVVEDQPVKHYRNLVGQQAVGQARSLLTRNHANGVQRLRPIPAVVEDRDIRIALRLRGCAHADQLLDRLLGHGRVPRTIR